MDNLLTRKDVASILRCSMQTIYEMEKAGTIPVVRMPGRRHPRYREEDIRNLTLPEKKEEIDKVTT